MERSESEEEYVDEEEEEADELYGTLGR